MRRRFFVEQFEGGRASLTGDAAHHVARVLRGERGQVYELSDGAALWLGRIERVSKSSVEFALVEELPVRAPSLHLTLLLSIVKFDRFEWALEKATELGVSEIVPLAAARSEKALVTAAGKRAARWEKILVESAQQARRLAAPVIRAAARPGEAFGSVGSSAGVRVVLSEHQDVKSLRAVLGEEGMTGDSKEPPLQKPSPRVGAVVAIGPEGGWTDEELAAARGAGFVEASLGANILRTETAVTAALAIVSFMYSDNSG